MFSSSRRRVSIAVLVLLGGVAPAIGADQSPTPQLVVAQTESGTALALEGESTFRVTAARVTDSRVIQLPESGTRLVLWSEQRASDVERFYAIGARGRAAQH